MGGRGATGVGVPLTKKQYEKLEDTAQLEDAIQNGLRLRARYYEYTDINGKVHKGQTGANTAGGTYRAEYSEGVAAYSKESTTKLEKELKELKASSDENYQRFHASAASKAAAFVKGFTDADTKIRMIDQILKRRRRNKK